MQEGATGNSSLLSNSTMAAPSEGCFASFVVRADVDLHGGDLRMQIM